MVAINLIWYQLNGSHKKRNDFSKSRNIYFCVFIVIEFQWVNPCVRFCFTPIYLCLHYIYPCLHFIFAWTLSSLSLPVLYPDVQSILACALSSYKLISIYNNKDVYLRSLRSAIHQNNCHTLKKRKKILLVACSKLFQEIIFHQ